VDKATDKLQRLAPTVYVDTASSLPGLVGGILTEYFDHN